MKLLVNINRLGQALQEAEIDTILPIITKGESADESNINNLIANQLLRWFKIPSQDIKRETLERYAKMSSKELSIPFTLAKPEIIEQRIIAPLESAKRFACAEEYLASIALSGLVGEMLAVFIWEMESSERKNAQGHAIQDQKILKNSFDRLQQSLRINVIEAFGYVDTTQAGKFRELAKNRNKILHSWTDSYLREEIEKIALECYSLVASLMKEIFKLGLKDAGSLTVDQKVMRYVKSKEPKIDSTDKSD